MRVAPAFGSSRKRGLMLGPIVQGCGIEIGARGPNDCVDFPVERNLSEDRRITQRAEKLALENGLKVNRATQTIIETQPQRVRRDVLN
jgi:hypothetical protein